MLRWAGDTFGDDFAITSSMADGLLSHLASRVIPGVNVIFLDTGYHFAETIGTRDWITSVLPITLVNVTPPQTVAEQDAVVRRRGCTTATPTCAARCARCSRWPRRWPATSPGARASAATSRRPAPARRLVDWDAKRGMVKVNPMAAWTQDDVDAYIAEHQIPVNPLFELGYGSIGCAPCTRAGRAGRGPARRPLGRPRQDRVRHPHLKDCHRAAASGQGWAACPVRRASPPTSSPPPCTGCPAWSGDGDGIRRTVELPSFRDAVAAIVRIADVAEEMDHHPDIDLRWRTLHLTLVSHSAGGVTELDLELARRIDALLPADPGARTDSPL